MKVALKIGMGLVLIYLLATVALKMYQDGHAEAFGQTKAYYAMALPTVPGAANPDITQVTLARTLCNPKWSTSQIRPSTSYTTPIKKRLLNGLNPADYELDHDWPIEDGGDPRSLDNLWIEPWHLNINGYDLGAKTKDRLENKVHDLICSGALPLQAVQKLFQDWPSAYKLYIGEWPKYSE